MPPLFLIILFSIGALALLVLGYCITFFLKGRHLQAEVGENDHMKAYGIKCTSQQIREDEADLRGIPVTEIPGICTDSACHRCTETCAPPKNSL
ncbi:MAG: hypothetical protein LUD68_10655 [Rikenellaceae bacterium]|nr:hypothetical protein [Rikenellaceae bacterium]